MQHKKPTFQQNKRQFKEPTSPHFSTQRRTSKPTQDKTGQPSATSAKKHYSLNTELQRADKQGTVPVFIKHRGTTTQTKKTGPLSPRAPEKIRKNRAEEMKVYGENACLTLFDVRPEAIVRVWATVQMSHKIGHILSYLANHKKAYHIVDQQELQLVSGSEHHGGICMLVKKNTPFSLAGYLQLERSQDCLVLLNQMGNAYNIGGLMRTCAYFGVRGLVVDNIDALHSSMALRIAEGGAEHLLSLETPYLHEGLQQLRQAGYQIIHLSQNKQAALITQTKFADKVVFVLSETDDDSLVMTGDKHIKIPHSYQLKQGLNVVVNAGILLSAWYNA
ncbi:TrmH RNA methyltransferase [Volucribacter psittacicida]|uniref:TrmH RNA methyltransferase n=1 Tax=Volucribacter psittacicida TaxID=203482 RepID=A0A4R1FXS9_9PAST|nr:TrmH family RNA methyltransferase [Volucribacter psittacicida]TCJ98612.1 TrmH RNA methyltransferase [Volucribacter psittacicida]